MLLEIGGRSLDLSQSIVMGILNVTPDSFSDGGCFDHLEAAVDQAKVMLEQGAQIIDIGGESTRPGAEAVSVEDELQRVIPVIKAIASIPNILISIDTSKPEVMRRAIAAGADMINDVSALQLPGALEAAAELGVPVCLMHMQGQPRTMQQSPQYNDVAMDVREFLQQRVDACVAAGIARKRLLLDPGFGFGKTLEHNYRLLSDLQKLQSLRLPLLIGISRKSMIGNLLNRPVEDRLAGSLSAAVIARMKGGQIFRVHDVAPTVDALKVIDMTLTQTSAE
ncbi:dihydropteroate synthase [Pelagibaculum spongiae]|uniref:Dihydropteroate synthase n=1 Tax=Pelagibaculum spongiae TaxID=2080658 RepID=A0A2V1GXF9_9GAMM|nr:dihydropteroate synthase [Pelagibaculum spongiae]PVZ71784.1 dihydropteroate synthase [Pelagibaculum spongiae]